MTGTRFMLKIVLVTIHYLAECTSCGVVASVLVTAKPNTLERKVPRCQRCGREMEPEPGTLNVRVQFEECQ